LRERILAAIDLANLEPIVHTWTHTIDEAAWYESTMEALV
jgi:hypothetical protein